MNNTDSHFPDCEVHRMPQRSDEWFDVRKGVLTASEFGAWLVAEKKIQLTIAEIKAELDNLAISYPKTGKKEVFEKLLPNVDQYTDYDQGSKEAREKAISKLIAQLPEEAWEPTSFENEATRRGSELEPHAVKSFEAHSGLKIEEVGFCRSKHGLFGCSPDGLVIGEPYGLESKVPIPATHVYYRRNGELPPEYKLQVHGCMAVTGATSWYFQSWNPGLASLRIKVERDEFTERVLKGLIDFSAQLETAITEEFDAWNLEFGEEPPLAVAA